MSAAEKAVLFGLFMAWSTVIYAVGYSTGRLRGAAEAYLDVLEKLRRESTRQ